MGGVDGMGGMGGFSESVQLDSEPTGAKLLSRLESCTTWRVTSRWKTSNSTIARGIALRKPATITRTERSRKSCVACYDAGMKGAALAAVDHKDLQRR